MHDQRHREPDDQLERDRDRREDDRRRPGAPKVRGAQGVDVVVEPDEPREARGDHAVFVQRKPDRVKDRVRRDERDHDQRGDHHRRTEAALPAEERPPPAVGDSEPLGLPLH